MSAQSQQCPLSLSHTRANSLSSPLSRLYSVPTSPPRGMGPHLLVGPTT